MPLHRFRRRSLAAALALVGALAVGAAAPGTAAPAAPRAAVVPPDAAPAAPVAIRLGAQFRRGVRLGQSTPLWVTLAIPRSSPSPVASINLRYPASLGIATSGLGLASCDKAPLGKRGPRGCSPNAVMGDGTAIVQARPYNLFESAAVTLLAAPVRQGHLGLLAYADGELPVGIQLVYTGELGDAPAPFGGDIHVDLPQVPDLPPDTAVALLRLRLVIGPRTLRYYDGRVAYHPEGIVLPDRCPRGAFPFRADVGFLDGTSATTRIRVACPPAPAFRR